MGFPIEQTGDGTEHDLASALPYSIAVPLERLRATEAAAGPAQPASFEALVKLHDGVVKTLTLLALSAYVGGDARRPAVDEVLRARFFARAATLGDWTELLRVLLEAHREARASFALPELLDFWFKSPDRAAVMSDDAALLLRFVGVRNDWAHLKLSDEQRAKAWGDFRPGFGRMLEALATLGNYRVCVPLRAVAEPNGKVRVTEIVSCIGTALARGDADVVARAPLQSGDELLLVRDGEEVLRLFPMMLPDLGAPEADGDDLLVYEKNRRQRLDSRAIARLDYVGVRAQRQVSVAAGGATSDVLASFRARLAEWLAQAPAPPVSEPDLDAPLDGPTFAAMPALVEEAARGVVGREELVQELAARASTGEGTVVLLTGAPGAGKTSALAAFVRSGTTKIAAAHLVGPDAGRDDPRLLVRALLAQVSTAFDLRRPVPDEYAAALKALHETLRELGEAGERVVVVVDAVDELRGGDVAFVPRVVPPNVTFVLSSRPGRVAEALARPRGFASVELGPPARAALLALARSIAPDRPEPALVRAVISSEGNPLFLRALLEAPLPAPGATLPASLDASFRDLLDRLAAGHGAPAEHALGLLAVARSGLSRRDLCALLGASPFQVGPLVRELRPWLVERDGRHLLFHARLREWVLAEAIGETLAAKRHGEVADLLRAQLPFERSDALADLPYHLEAAGRSAELLALVDGGFAARKAHAMGSLEAIREDLVRAARASDGDVVRAARYGLAAALLARGARDLSRHGVVTALARVGEPRLAAALARAIPEPKEREQAVVAVAMAVAPRDPRFALALCDEIPDTARREVAAAQVRNAEPLSASAGAVAADVRAAATDALLGVDRGLRVRTMVGAASGLPKDQARRLLARATEEAVAEPSPELRDALVVEVARALAPVDAREASIVAQGLPKGAARVRALVAAGDGASALVEVEELADEQAKEAALADALEAMAVVDAKEVQRRLPALSSPADRDRVLLALVVATKGLLLAAKIDDPLVRVQALGTIGEWEEAEAAADEVRGASARAAAYERLACAAASLDASRAGKYRAQAATLRGGIASDEERATSWREAAALWTATHPEWARAAIDRALALDPTYDAGRDAVVRRARIELGAPTADRVRESIAAAAAWGDAFAEVFPDVARAVSSAFAHRHAGLAEALLSALDWSEKKVASILSSGIGDGDADVPAPAPLPPDVVRAMNEAGWGSIPPPPSIVPEIDHLERRLRDGVASQREVDRLVELRLAKAERGAAVGSLLAWANAARARGDGGAAEAAIVRAASIDATDPRIAEARRVTAPPPPRAQSAFAGAPPPPARAAAAGAPTPSAAPPPSARVPSAEELKLDDSWGEFEAAPSTTREEPTRGAPPWQNTEMRPLGAQETALDKPAEKPPEKPAEPVAPPPESKRPVFNEELGIPTIAGGDDDLDESEFTAVMSRDQQRELKRAAGLELKPSLRQEREEAARRASEADAEEASAIENKPTVPPPAATAAGNEAVTAPPPRDGVAERIEVPSVHLPKAAPVPQEAAPVPADSQEAAPIVTVEGQAEIPAPSEAPPAPLAKPQRPMALYLVIVVLAIVFVVLVALAATRH